MLIHCLLKAIYWKINRLRKKMISFWYWLHRTILSNSQYSLRNSTFNIWTLWTMEYQIMLKDLIISIEIQCIMHQYWSNNILIYIWFCVSKITHFFMNQYRHMILFGKLKSWSFWISGLNSKKWHATTDMINRICMKLS